MTSVRSVPADAAENRVLPPPAAATEPISQPLLLRVEEAAERLSISRTSLYALLRAGEITSVHIGRSIRIPVSTLNAYVDRLLRLGL